MRLTGPETDRLLFDESDVASVGSVTTARGGQPSLPLVLTDEATTTVTGTVRAVGLADDPDAFEVVQTHDGEVTAWFGITPALAEGVASRSWEGVPPAVRTTRGGGGTPTTLVRGTPA